jgi:Kef-type K+ transport system membrane component KefB
MSSADLILRLFLQLAVILAACQLVGWIGRRVGQSPVIGELLAGILLGPSLFGLLWPAAQRALFPQTLTVGGTTITHPSMSILYVLSHLGLALYMFLVGLEFDTSLLRGRVRRAATISVSGILVPLVLGGVCSLILYREGGLFGQRVSPSMAALFLGVSLSITAFPVLARMLQHYHLTHTRLGSLVLTMAAVNDVTAWCLLALVLASLNHSPSVALVTIGGGALYAAGMLVLGRRGLRVFARIAELPGGVSPASVSQDLIVLVLLVVLVCSWLTTALGIYEVFGAFVVGVAMPRGYLAETLQNRLEGLTTGLLLPIFFVYSGLNTRLALVNTPTLWLVTGLIIFIAIAGKGIACTLSARLSRYSWRESATIGALMNARGLIELIVLNIGLEAHVITPTLFTMLVLMALFTTLMASPVYQWLAGRSATKERVRDTNADEAVASVVLPAAGD